jgi:hypothetical protein
MRKIDPAGVRADFERESGEIIGYFDRTSNAIIGTPNARGDTSHLAAHSFLALFVAFERFLSDLFLAYLNRDFSVYQASLVSRLDTSIKDKFGVGVRSLITVNPKKHVRVDELEEIVDPTGWNLTFPTVHKLKSCADQWLAPEHAARVRSITASEGRLIETARAIRDFAAHQSVGSKRKMNQLLATVEAGAHNRHLGRAGNQVHSIGSYLKASAAGRRRLHLYSDGLLAISAHV